MKISCSHCRGTGKVTFNGKFAETLVLLRKQPAEVNGAQLAALAGIAGTAMNNRLVWLEKHGFAIGRSFGRERLWKAK